MPKIDIKQQTKYRKRSIPFPKKKVNDVYDEPDVNIVINDPLTQANALLTVQHVVET